MIKPVNPGPILMGIEGLALNSKSREQLLHPAVGGVVLFSRNFKDIEQLTELVRDIKNIRYPSLLVCIDQEGGRVQRLKEGFTALPPLGAIGTLYLEDADKAMDMAYRHARVMATEVLASGIDLSFAPVLDLDRGSSVIGDRSLSRTVDVVVRLGRAYLAGMHDAGMKTTGKHFPGHGSVKADSHTHDAMDTRTLPELEASDLVPFIELAPDLDALMIAHVVYSEIDQQPAGYSRTWLIDCLRKQHAYKGVIMSDDLGMHAAWVAGDLFDRTHRCLEAGCDLVLVCRPEDVEELLKRIDGPIVDAGHAIASLYGSARISHEEMAMLQSQGVGEWRQWQESLITLSTSRIHPGV